MYIYVNIFFLINSFYFLLIFSLYILKLSLSYIIRHAYNQISSTVWAAPRPCGLLQGSPPGRVSSLTSGISQQLSSERGVNPSLQAVGGSLALSLAAGNERPPAVHKCRSDCLTCPVLIKSKNFTSFVTGQTYSAIDIEPFLVHCKLKNYIYMLCCLSCGV